MSQRPCQVCKQPTRSTYCATCFEYLWPEAFRRAADTRHAGQTASTADAYEQARQADEADAPIKRRGPA